MKLSQYKHIRISESGDLFSYVSEYKGYILLKLYDCNHQTLFCKKYYNITISSIIKCFYVKDNLKLFFLRDGIYYLDSISIKSGHVLTQRQCYPNLLNCNLFYGENLYVLTTFEKNKRSNVITSCIYYLESEDIPQKIIEIPGIVEQVFVTSDKLYLNIICTNGTKKIYVMEPRGETYELIDNFQKISLNLLDANNNYIVASADFIKKTNEFVMESLSGRFVNLCSYTTSQIHYARVYNDALFVITHKGCNDELLFIDLLKNRCTSISNIGAILPHLSFNNGKVFFFLSTYNSLSYFCYNVNTGNREILWEKKCYMPTTMRIESINVGNAPIEIMHFYYDGKSKGTVFYLHGGPATHFKNEYRQITDFLSHEGYDIVCVNYRGSTGYGTEFERQIDKKWGEVEIEDVISVAEQLSSPNNILFGESYGAFLSLHAVLKRPKLWHKCCLLSPFISPLSMYNNPDCSNKDFFKKQLESKTSTCNFDTLFYTKCKILIVHGKDDSVIPISESQRLVKILEDHYKIEGSDFWFSPGTFKHSLKASSEVNFFIRTFRLFLRK